MSEKLTYKSAGVDLEQYEQAMARLPAMMQRTHGARVLPLAGGFAGLFQLHGDGRMYEDPVLVSGTDGVGTKLKVAQAAGVFNTVGIDLVAMCVNDCLCLGAEPLFFLDYLALDRDDPEKIAQLVEGVSEGCVRGKLSLIGGETAIMPDVYPPGEFDMAGFCVGVVERSRLIDGSAISAGDVILGIDSDGLHSNGFSLVRKIVFEHAGLQVDDHVAELNQTVGETLMKPTRIYADVVGALMKCDAAQAVHGIAHITGGGLQENIDRLLPNGLSAKIDHDSWDVPPIFGWLQSLGNVETEEMARVFNMGIGLTVVVDVAHIDKLREAIAEPGVGVRVIGEIAG